VTNAPSVQRAVFADRLLKTVRILAIGNRGSLVLLRSGLNVFGAAWFVYVLATSQAIIGFDTISYWLVDPSDLYRWTDSSTVAGPFRYSPVLGQLIDPLGMLPWATFQALFLALTLGTLVILGGRWALALLLIPSVLGEVYLGNIDLFIAVSMGLGLLFPPAWAFLLLSKATPAVVLVWFIARGEWRKLGLVLGTAAVIAAPSLLTTPDLWVEWARASTQYASSTYGLSTIPAIPRLVAAAVLISVGARRGWVWTIAVGGTLAMPGLDWKTATTMLAILPLYRLGLLAERWWRTDRPAQPPNP